MHEMVSDVPFTYGIVVLVVRVALPFVLVG